MPLKGGCATSDIGFLSPFFIKEEREREGENPTHPPPSIAARPADKTTSQTSVTFRTLPRGCQPGEELREGGEEVEYITVYAEPKLQDVLPLCLSSELDV